MLFRPNNYFHFFNLKTITGIALISILASTAVAQNGPIKKDTFSFHINPQYISSFKDMLKANPNLNEHFKRPNNQLMSWPNYPLTAAQIEQRDKKYYLPWGQQLVSDIIGTYLNGVINSKKDKPAASVPKF